MTRSNAAQPNSPPSFIQRLWRQTRPGDLFIAAVFLFLAGGSFWLENLLSPHEQTAQFAQVFVRNRLVTEVDLQQAGTTTIGGILGQVTLSVAAGSIRVATSSCPNQYCIKQGAIHRPQQMLVCVPNHLLVVIAGEEQTNLDAVTF